MKPSHSMLFTSLVFLLVLSFPQSGYGDDGPELPPPPNMKLSLKLLSPISTATSKKGDKFSCRVLTPDEYIGAIAEGHIQDLKRSGKANKDSRINLAFERITMPDGRTADFSATVIEVFEVLNAGDQGRADNEGTVRNKSSTVKTSVKRAAVGALVGGVLGALVGGGQGAAIGAAIGASIGVTTTLAQKGPDLEFKEGTQFTVVSNGPVRKKNQPAFANANTGAASNVASQPSNDASTVPDPASRNYRTYTANKSFIVSIPDNWREFSAESSVVFAPNGGYIVSQGQTDFTHAIMLGTVHVQNEDLGGASVEYVNAMLKVNSYLQRNGDNERVRIAGHDAIKILVSGTSNSTKRTEYVFIYSVLLHDGSLFYVNMVVPADELASYESAFQTILKSIEIHDQ